MSMCQFWMLKRTEIFNMLALEGVVVDETEPLCKIAGMQDSWYARW